MISFDQFPSLAKKTNLECFSELPVPQDEELYLVAFLDSTAPLPMVIPFL